MLGARQAYLEAELGKAAMDFMYPRAMEKNEPKGRETVEQFKARLRKAAFSLPKSEVLAAVASMKKRAKAVVDSSGGDIDLD